MEIKEVTKGDFVLYLTRFLGGKREEEGDGRRGWERRGGGGRTSDAGDPQACNNFQSGKTFLSPTICPKAQ